MVQKLNQVYFSKVFKILHFVKFFYDNSKIVVSKNNECHFEVLRVSNNVDCVP